MAKQAASTLQVWPPPSTIWRSRRYRSALRLQASCARKVEELNRREFTTPKHAYRQQSSGGIPFKLRHRFHRRIECDGRVAKWIARLHRGGNGEWQDDHLDGLAATKREIAKRQCAVLGKDGLCSMCLHDGKVARFRPMSKRPFLPDVKDQPTPKALAASVCPALLWHDGQSRTGSQNLLVNGVEAYA